MTATDERQTLRRPGAAQLLRVPYQSTATGEERDFLLYLPAGYDADPDRRWPVLFFLHGGGERGDGKEDLDYVLVHGPLTEAWIRHRDLPFVIISPQLPVFDMDHQAAAQAGTPKPVRLSAPPPAIPEDRPARPMLRAADPTPALFGVTQAWGDEGFPGGWQNCQEDLIAILDGVLASYRTDPDCVYLTGLSYGGHGTWHMAAACPDRWAAIAPSVATPTRRRWLCSPNGSCRSGCFKAAAIWSSSPSGPTTWPTRSTAPVTRPSALRYTRTSATTAGRGSTAGRISTAGCLNSGGDAAAIMERQIRYPSDRVRPQTK